MKINNKIIFLSINIAGLIGFIYYGTCWGGILNSEKAYYQSTHNLARETFRDKMGVVVLEKTYYPNGQTESEISTKYNGDKVFITYYRNGSILSKSFSRDNEPMGISRDYYKYGKIMSKKFRKKNNQFTKKDYYENGGLSIYSTKYETKFYSEDGDLRGYSITRPSLNTQERKAFYEEGSIQEVGTKNLKTYEGYTKQFYRDGKLSGEYSYDKNLKLIWVKKYDKNKKIIFNKTAKEMLDEENIYKSGQKSGKLTQCSNGGFFEECIYENGKLTSRVLYNQNGDIIQDQNISKGYWKFYFDNGNLMSVTQKTSIGSESKSFSEGGKLRSETKEYKSKDNEDMQENVRYFNNGKVLSVRVFQGGKIIHKEEYSESGKLLMKQDIKNGPVDLI